MAFAIDQADAEVVRKELELATGKTIEGELELKHLMQYALLIQSRKAGDFNYRSLKNQLDGALQEQIWNVMISPDLTNTQWLSIFKEIQPLFVSITPSPYDTYGMPAGMGSREVVVQKMLKTVLEGPVMQAIRLNPELKRRIDIAALTKHLEQIVERALPLLPDTLTDRPQYGLQKQVEVEGQKEKEKDKEKEKEKEKETVRETESLGFLYPTFRGSHAALRIFFSN